MKKWIIRIDRAAQDTAKSPNKTLYLNIGKQSQAFSFSGVPTLFDSKDEAQLFMDHPLFNSAFLYEAHIGDSAAIYYRESYINHAERW